MILHDNNNETIQIAYHIDNDSPMVFYNSMLSLRWVEAGTNARDAGTEGRKPFVCRRIIRQEKPIRRARARISRRTLKNSRVSIFQKRTRSRSCTRNKAGMPPTGRGPAAPDIFRRKIEIYAKRT